MLHCQATGEPAPAVEWTRAEKPLQENHRVQILANSTLLIGAVEETDTGLYECVARNLMGSSVVQAFLTVRGTCPRGLDSPQRFTFCSVWVILLLPSAWERDSPLL